MAVLIYLITEGGSVRWDSGLEPAETGMNALDGLIDKLRNVTL